MTKEELLNMELHQTIIVNAQLSILRVFCGWVYQCVGGNVFVPEEINVEAHTTDVTDRTHEY